MRIILLQSSAKHARLEKDVYHVSLFDSINIRYKSLNHLILDENVANQGEITFVEDLPCGMIVGVLLLGDQTFYTGTEDEYTDPWCLGPMFYYIRDRIMLDPDEYIPCRGNLGFFKVETKVLNELLKIKKITEKIEYWRKKHKDIYEEKNYRGLSIKQPFVEAIRLGFKLVENRKRSLGPLSNYKTNIEIPNKITCKFCINKKKCTFWNHKGTNLRSHFSYLNKEYKDDYNWYQETYGPFNKVDPLNMKELRKHKQINNILSKKVILKFESGKTMIIHPKSNKNFKNNKKNDENITNKCETPFASRAKLSKSHSFIGLKRTRGDLEMMAAEYDGKRRRSGRLLLKKFNSTNL